MIFLLDKNEKEKIDKLIDTYIYNSEVSDYLNDSIINEDLISEAVVDYNIQELSIDEYVNDNYYQKVKPKEIKIGPYQIKYEKYRPYQCFLFDDIDVDEEDYFLVKNKIGYFIKEYKYLTIQKNNVIWMSIIPHEINTMKKCINNLSKHVYVMGLGLAYFPYLIASKVDKITIIENDSHIINLFKKYIFPFFSYKEKYEIINEDAYQYINKIPINDTVFIDLWHNPQDGFTSFCKLNKLLDKHHAIYWINDSLIMAFRNILINLIKEELYEKLDYHRANNEIDKITNRLHEILKEVRINKYQQIKQLLSSESIHDLILKV